MLSAIKNFFRTVKPNRQAKKDWYLKGTHKKKFLLLMKLAKEHRKNKRYADEWLFLSYAERFQPLPLDIVPYYGTITPYNERLERMLLKSKNKCNSTLGIFQDEHYTEQLKDFLQSYQDHHQAYQILNDILLDEYLSGRAHLLQHITPNIVASNIDIAQLSTYKHGLLVTHMNSYRSEYGHYVLSFIWPLLDRISTGVFDPDTVYFLLDFTPSLNKEVTWLADQLNIKLVLLDHKKYNNTFVYNCTSHQYVNYISLHTYDYQINRTGRFWHLDRLKANLLKYLSIDCTPKDKQEMNILFVDRPIASDYITESPSGVSGGKRRSIPNADALYQAICSKYSNVKMIAFEEITMLEKIQACNAADIIITQSGSAITNLYAAKAGSYFIEITPPFICNCSNPQIYLEWHADIAIVNQLNHLVINQRGNHTPVEIEPVMRVLQVIEKEIQEKNQRVDH